MTRGRRGQKVARAAKGGEADGSVAAGPVPGAPRAERSPAADLLLEGSPPLRRALGWERPLVARGEATAAFLGAGRAAGGSVGFQGPAPGPAGPGVVSGGAGGARASR